MGISVCEGVLIVLMYLYRVGQDPNDDHGGPLSRVLRRLGTR